MKLQKVLRMISLRRLFLVVSYYSGLLHLIRFLNRKQIVIFTIHGVVGEDSYPWQTMRKQCPLGRYEKVLTVLKNYFQFVSLDDAVAMIAGEKPAKPYCAVLTFDDGYKNNVTTALPVLQKYHLPATFFLPTSFIGSNKVFWFDALDYTTQHCTTKPFDLSIGEDSFSFDMKNRQEMKEQFRRFLYQYNHSQSNDLSWQTDILSQIDSWQIDSGLDYSSILNHDPRTAKMTWMDVEEAYASGVSIGSHSVGHLKLGTLDNPQIKEQLQHSKEDIESHLKTQCDYVSYPNGNYNDRVVQIAAECGYKAALTTEIGLNAIGCDLYRLRRVSLPLREVKPHVLNHIYISGNLRQQSRENQLDDVILDQSLSKKNNEETLNNTRRSSSKGNDAGLERMAKNVWIGWIAQIIYVVAGFVMPRMINNSMGQEALGVWDFSWTLIAYFSLVLAGVISSVNPYISKYQAVDDVENVNVSASSVGCILIVMALFVVLITLSVQQLLPAMMGDKLGAHLLDTQKVIFWLGMSLSVQILFAVFGGVLAGSFRWDIHYYINALSRVATLIGMVFVLLFDGGLVKLAMVYCLCEAAVLSVRVVYAYRVYPKLKIKASYVRWSRAKEMLLFGVKTYLPQVGDMVTNQSLNVLIIWFMGPAALAIYNRPRALMRHVQTFLTRYAFVLTPTASAMYAKKDHSAFGRLLIDGSKNGAFILLPAIFFLAFFGDSLLEVWMGQGYVKAHLFLVMIIAFLPPIFQLPLVSVVAGANMHGRLGMMRLFASLVGLLFVYVSFQIVDLDITWAVAMFAVPLWFSEFLYAPWYVNKHFSMAIGEYMQECLVRPLVTLLPFVFVLLLAKITIEQPVIQLLAGGALGGTVLALLYWNFVFTESFQEKLKNKLLSRLTQK